MSNDPLLLIDGDEVVYRIAAALEHEVQWDEQNWVLYSNADAVFDEVKAHMGRLFERFGTERHVLAFTGSGNFRKVLVDPTYKNNRAGKRKPLCYGTVRERCDLSFHTMVRPGLEADDVLGILATKPGAGRKIICGQDKDFKTVPAEVWNGKDLLRSYEADRFHMLQTLCGDAADGYKGCPGIGPAKAVKILADENGYDLHEYEDTWPKVVKAFYDADYGYDYALSQARLARILRWEDWDQEKQEPILWTPPPSPDCQK